VDIRLALIAKTTNHFSILFNDFLKTYKYSNVVTIPFERINKVGKKVGNNIVYYVISNAVNKEIKEKNKTKKENLSYYYWQKNKAF
jgi:hypothetical protein